MGHSRLHDEVMGMTGRYTFCWCEGQAPQSNGQPCSDTGLLMRRGGVFGATKESASRYHSTDEATRHSSWPCVGQNLSNQTASSLKTIFASTEALQVPHRLFVIE